MKKEASGALGRGGWDRGSGKPWVDPSQPEELGSCGLYNQIPPRNAQSSAPRNLQPNVRTEMLGGRSICFRCGKLGHFAMDCPSFVDLTQEYGTLQGIGVKDAKVQRQSGRLQSVVNSDLVVPRKDKSVRAGPRMGSGCDVQKSTSTSSTSRQESGTLRRKKEFEEEIATYLTTVEPRYRKDYAETIERCRQVFGEDVHHICAEEALRRTAEKDVSLCGPYVGCFDIDCDCSTCRWRAHCATRQWKVTDEDLEGPSTDIQESVETEDEMIEEDEEPKGQGQGPKKRTAARRERRKKKKQDERTQKEKQVPHEVKKKSMGKVEVHTKHEVRRRAEGRARGQPQGHHH